MYYIIYCISSSATDPPPLPERHSILRTDDAFIKELEQLNADLSRQLSIKKRRKRERKIKRLKAEIHQKKTELDSITGNIKRKI